MPAQPNDELSVPLDTAQERVERVEELYEMTRRRLAAAQRHHDQSAGLMEAAREALNATDARLGRSVDPPLPE